MKRIVTMLLAVLLAMGVCACGQSSTTGREPTGTYQENYDLGLKYLSEGNYAEAILAFTAAIQIDPKQVDAYVSLAEAYMAAGNQAAAVQALKDGLDATGDETLNDFILWAETSQDTSVKVEEIQRVLGQSDEGRLTVQILGERTVRITLRDENMQPSYAVKKENAEDGGWDFSWRVDFSNDTDQGIWRVGTFGFKSQLEDGDYTVAQLVHEVGVYDSYEYREGMVWGWRGSGIYEADIRTSVWQDGITWLVTFPDNEDTVGMNLLETKWFVAEISDDTRQIGICESYVVNEDGSITQVDALEDINFEKP